MDTSAGTEYKARLRNGPSSVGNSQWQFPSSPEYNLTPVCFTPRTPTPSQLTDEVREMWRKAATPKKLATAPTEETIETELTETTTDFNEITSRICRSASQ